jgi:hypothetical protein
MKLFFAYVITFLSLSAYCQDSAKTTDTAGPTHTVVDTATEIDLTDGNNATSDITPQKVKAITSLEFWLSISVLLFGLIITSLGLYIIRKENKTAVDTENLIRFIAVILIITGTLFLITAGYENAQINPALGLLGTIAGYLLGKSSNTKQ